MRNTNQSPGLRFFFVIVFVLFATCASFVAPLEATAEGFPLDPPAEDDTLSDPIDTLHAVNPTPETASSWEIILTLIDIII